MSTRAHDIENTPFWSGTYRFSTTICHENPRLCKRYTREVLVQQLHLKKGETTFQFLCKYYEFDDPHVSVLVRKMAYLFDILLLTIDKEGHILTVENESKLQEKWELLRAALQKEHAGSAWDNYLYSINQILYDSEKLIAFLESNHMYGIFFKGLWLYNHAENEAEYVVERSKFSLSISHQSNHPAKNVTYLFQNNILTEGLILNNHLQYEVLCLG
ncbi:hypothetical protein [Pedobacter sp. MW01-1-1]|uniref:hypothetical protein n=1 Tax=Pedobacter sp. MW01-1-1 TaxID=3383027 RepID=UPI003FEED0DF